MQIPSEGLSSMQVIATSVRGIELGAGESLTFMWARYGGGMHALKSVLKEVEPGHFVIDVRKGEEGREDFAATVLDWIKHSDFDHTIEVLKQFKEIGDQVKPKAMREYLLSFDPDEITDAKARLVVKLVLAIGTCYTSSGETGKKTFSSEVDFDKGLRIIEELLTLETEPIGRALLEGTRKQIMDHTSQRKGTLTEFLNDMGDKPVTLRDILGDQMQEDS